MPDDTQPDTAWFTRRRAAKATFTAVVGTAAALLATSEARAGYGACSASGCPCRGYMGNQDLCQNCGHQYSMHW